MKAVSDYTIVDHGVEHSQYFQGEGTSFTDYIDCATGIGCSAHEAMEDALDNLAQQDWDVGSIPNEQSAVEHELGDECWYFLTVKVK